MPQPLAKIRSMTGWEAPERVQGMEVENYNPAAQTTRTETVTLFIFMLLC